MDTRYVYKTLPSPRHIRLLRLYGGKKSEEVSCELFIVSLDEVLSFEALSYTWGNPLPRMPVRCSGKTTEIGQSLHSALRYLRHESNIRILWADALCINQEDIQERNAQVRLMGEIYGKAEKTLIWLGEDPDEQTYEVFQALVAFQETLHKKGITIFNFKEHDQYNKEVFREVISSHSRMLAVMNLFEHPWFGRKWIIQELVNSRNPVVISGMNCLPWHILESFATLLRWTTAWVGMGVLDLRSTSKDHVLNVISLAQIRREKDTFSLADHIYKTLSFDCTQPHDHLIAILGLANNSDKDRFSSLSDYSIHETELWWRYASIAIKSGSLTPLLLVDTLPLADRPISWVADLSRLSQSTKSEITSIMGTLLVLTSRTPDEISSQNFTKSFSRFSNASKTTTAAAQISEDGRILSIEGVFVGQVEEMTSREMPSIGEEIQIGTFYSMPGKCSIQQKIWNEALSMAFRGIGHKNRAKRIRAWTECTRAWMFDVNDSLSMTYLLLYHLAKRKWHLLSDPRVESIGKVPFRPDDRTMAEMNELYEDETFRKILRADRPAVGHHFCRTTEGWLGWVTSYSRPGDRICIIRGSRVPHVLRPSGDGTYKLIGQCYIQGVMNGEYLMYFLDKKETIRIS
ncbi:hypothetical protein Daesc_006294 [Daldinia eschscholtzii]|uniref:Heterokaryon incompatibility domain-containing protein n=1 Tax=Daldinia eschscholtzii TaxID=292717 RepID=A0AAX6MHX7_9PEZI